jgi:hypothetical protein
MCFPNHPRLPFSSSSFPISPLFRTASSAAYTLSTYHYYHEIRACRCLVSVATCMPQCVAMRSSHRRNLFTQKDLARVFFFFSHGSREGLSTYNSTHSSTLKKLECVSDVDRPTPPRAALACRPKCGGEGPEQTRFGLIVLQKMYLQ